MEQLNNPANWYEPTQRDLDEAKEVTKTLLERQSAVRSVKKILEEIKTEVVQDIFEMYLRNIRTKKDDRLVLREGVDVIADEDMRGMGRYGAADRKQGRKSITLNAIRLTGEDHLETKYNVVHTYLHEEVHATSDRREAIQTGEDVQDTHIGFTKRRNFGGVSITQDYKLLNEGMTELIAGKITEEYFRRTGDIPGEQRRIFAEKTSASVYPQAVSEVKRLISELSCEYKIDDSAVEGALIRFFFESEEGYQYFPEWLEENNSELAKKMKDLV